MQLFPLIMPRINLSKSIALLCALSAHLLFISELYRAPQKFEFGRNPRSKPTLNTFTINLTRETKSDSPPFKENVSSQEESRSLRKNNHDEGDASLVGAQTKAVNYYFKTNEVTQKPQVIVDLPMEFSLPAIPGLRQSLEMTLQISDTGNIDNVLIAADDLDDNARRKIIDAFQAMLFQPALIGDIPVASEIRIEVFGTDIP